MLKVCLCAGGVSPQFAGDDERGQEPASGARPGEEGGQPEAGADDKRTPSWFETALVVHVAVCVLLDSCEKRCLHNDEC